MLYVDVSIEYFRQLGSLHIGYRFLQITQVTVESMGWCKLKFFGDRAGPENWPYNLKCLQVSVDHNRKFLESIEK